MKDDLARRTARMPTTYLSEPGKDEDDSISTYIVGG